MYQSTFTKAVLCSLTCVGLFSFSHEGKGAQSDDSRAQWQNSTEDATASFLRGSRRNNETPDPTDRVYECSLSSDVPDSWADLTRPAKGMLSFVSHSRLEGTGNCYHYMFGHVPFYSFDKHPGKRPGTWSSAAGRYQFLTKTWNSLVKMEGYYNFGPYYQDLGAIKLMRLRKFYGYNKVLSYSEFGEAMKKISYEWASLPPNRYGQTRVSTISEAYKIYKWVLR